MEQYIVEFVAILILGFFIWIAIKSETLWRRFGVWSFLKTHKKVVFAVLLVGVIAFGGWTFYEQRQAAEWACLQQIQYHPKGGGFYDIYEPRGENPQFKTRDEALGYCLLTLD